MPPMPPAPPVTMTPCPAKRPLRTKFHWGSLKYVHFWIRAQQSDHYGQNFIGGSLKFVFRIEAHLVWDASRRGCSAMLRPDMVKDLYRRGSWSELIQRDTEWSRWTVAGVPESTALLAGGVSVATRSNGYTSQSGQTSIVVSPLKVLEKKVGNPGFQSQDELWCRKSQRCCCV